MVFDTSQGMMIISECRILALLGCLYARGFGRCVRRITLTSLCLKGIDLLKICIVREAEEVDNKTHLKSKDFVLKCTF